MERAARQSGRAGRSGLQAELRRNGLRATASRLAVLETLRQAPSPVSHGDVADALREHGWDRTTIYRNLLDLTRVGLARRLDIGDHVWRFEPAGPDDRSSGLHWRFVCTDCGRVLELGGLHLAVDDDASVPASIRERHAELQVRGLCDDCSPSAAAAPAGHRVGRSGGRPAGAHRRKRPSGSEAGG